MKKIVALVLAMVMVLGLATTAFAAKGGVNYGDASKTYDWNFVVTPEDNGDEEDQTFPTYTIEAIALKNNIKAPWITPSDVYEATDDVDIEIGTEDEFVKIANANMAKFVVVDGKTVTYFVPNSEDLVWAGKAVKVTLPVAPMDGGDWACNTLYAEGAATATYYYYDGVLFQAKDNGPVILNVDGVAVYTEATELPETTDNRGVYDAGGYFYNPHSYKADYASKTAATNHTVEKVYCEFCKAEFKAVQFNDKGVKTDALAAGVFGEDNYQWIAPLSLYIEKVSPAIPGVSAGTVVAPADKDDDKVESPKTFDAGIAMYVGMSVMAAAGSAVVLKKKD